MNNKLPEWHNEGMEPMEELKRNGWKKGDRPPFQYLNWFMNRCYAALKFLQETKVSMVDVEDYLKNNISSGVNVMKYGARNDGSEDASEAIQQAINAARQVAIDTQLGGDCTVLFPAGRYRLDRQIVSSPFVKLKSVGRVVFETYVRDDSALWITPQFDDPVFTDMFRKQQWFRAPLINGIDGGFIFSNKLGTRTGNSTAIEFGSREDLTFERPISRYCSNDIAVEKYNVAFKMNQWRHYIASFTRLHLEVNDTCVVYGNPNSVVLDSGENIHFSDCVFAVCDTAFLWNVDGFDTHFVNCSFDFIDTVFRIRRGFKVITLTGGHIEAIYSRILIHESTHTADAGVVATFAMRGTAMYIKKGKMFEAQAVNTQLIDLYFDGVEYRQMANDNLYVEPFWVDDNFTVRSSKITTQSKGIMVQKGLSRTSDAFMERATVGNINLVNGKAQVSNFEVVYANGTAAIVAAPELGTNCKAITFTGADDSGTITIKTSPIPARAGEQVVAHYALYLNKEPRINGFIHFNFYDNEGVLLFRKSQNLTWLGSLNLVTGKWLIPNVPSRAKAPAGTSTVTVEYNLSREPMNGFETKMSCFYVEI